MRVSVSTHCELMHHEHAHRHFERSEKSLFSGGQRLLPHPAVFRARICSAGCIGCAGAWLI